MYRAVTHDISVSVVPDFLPDQSSPGDDLYTWSYEVTIHNMGLETVQLLSRYWRIVDGHGKITEVRGEGVVGLQPVIHPGESHVYSSGTRLNSPTGFMGGSYGMTRSTGERIVVTIPDFSLDSPHASMQPQ